MKYDFFNLHRIGGHFILLVLCLAVAAAANGQSNYQKGYVVTTTSDTIRGYIDQKEWTRNPAEVAVKKSIDDPAPREFTRGNMVYFALDNGVSFQRYVVSMSMDKVSLENLGVPKEVPVTDTVFLKVLQSGKNVALFSYRDKLKTRYYLKFTGSGTPEELIYRLYTETYNADRYSNAESKSLVEKTDDTYKEQLLLAAQRAGVNSEKLKWQVKKTSYLRNGLLAIVSKINGLDARSTSAGVNKIGWGVFVGAGLNHSNLSYSGGGDYSKSSSSYSYPFFSVGINMLGNRDAGRIMLRAEISWSAAKFHTVANYRPYTTYPLRIDYTFSQQTTSPSLHFLYALNNSKNLKIYLGVGFRINLSSYSNNMYTATTTYDTNPYNANVAKTPDFFHLNHMWYSGVLQAGIMIHRKIEIAASYNPGATLNRNEALWSESINSVRAGVNYLLWKK